jgi:hypothetical protein
MCKVNPVANVMTMMSIAGGRKLWPQPCDIVLLAYSAMASAQKKLDNESATDIIIFTGIFDATRSRQDPQTPSAPPARGSQPALAGCTARVVSKQQFLSTRRTWSRSSTRCSVKSESTGSPSARRRKLSDSPGLRSIRPSLRFSKLAWRGCFQKSGVRAAVTN